MRLQLSSIKPNKRVDLKNDATVLQYFSCFPRLRRSFQWNRNNTKKPTEMKYFFNMQVIAHSNYIIFHN